MSEIFGLGKGEYYELLEIIRKHSKNIKKVIFFGSRARGDNKEYSDIDLAIIFRENNILYRLIEEFDDSSLIYTVDIIDYERITKKGLKKNIDEEGKEIFLTNKEGEIMIIETKLKYKFEEYSKAVKRLKIALQLDINENEIYLDGIIKRFEFCYELSWKLMKEYIENEGIESVKSPRSAIRESFKMNLIEKDNGWLDMIGDRNRTSHTYNEETALDIYENIKKKYINSFEKLKMKLEKRLNNKES